MLPHRVPCLEKSMFGFIFCCHYFEILNNSGTRDPTFSFCTESYKLHRWSGEEYSLPLQFSSRNVLLYNYHHGELATLIFVSSRRVKNPLSKEAFDLFFFTVSKAVNSLPEGKGKALRAENFFFSTRF